MNHGLHKRGPVWHYAFSINKTRHRGSTGTRSKTLAKDFTDNLYTSLYYSDNKIKKPRPEVKDFLAYHLESDKNNLSRDWHHIKSATLHRFCDYLKEQGISFLDEVELEHIELFKSRLLKIRKPKTVKNNIVVISSLFNPCVDCRVYKTAKKCIFS